MVKFENNPRHRSFLNLSSNHFVACKLELSDLWDRDDFITKYSINYFSIARLFLKGNSELYHRLGSRSFYHDCGKIDPNLPKFQFEHLEAHRSRQSLKLLNANFEEWKSVFYGNYRGQDKMGYDDYLLQQNYITLVDSINIAVNRCENRLAALEQLEDDVVNNFTKVTLAGDAFIELRRLMWVDFTAATEVLVDISDHDCD